MPKPHVLVIPYPAQGHVIPIMELAQRLAKHRVRVTCINTEVNHKLVTGNCLDKDGLGDVVQMVSIPDGLEPWEDRSDIRKLTLSILQTMPRKLEELIETINKEDSSKVTCIIADGFMGWAIRVAKKMGISSAAFWPASVATLASFLSFQKLIDDGIINKNGIPLSDEMIQLSETMPPIKPQNLAWACFEDSTITQVFFKFVVQTAEASRLIQRFICNSCPELEAAAFSMYPQLQPIGPLLARNRLADQAGQFLQEDTTCLTWLDQQPPCSVIYVAFGSSTTFNQTQFEELALGLELSNRPFLWVVRPGMTKETATGYPDGYVKRVGSRGRIVKWAPQQKLYLKPQNLAWACFEDSALVEVIFKMVLQAEEASRLTEWFICNSCPELEAAAFSLYPQLLPIGPLLASNRLAVQAGHFWQEDSTCLAWLDQQPVSSVIYVAFGSFTMFNQTQFEELAHGLELSNRPFLWVVRPGMTKETTTDYPEGYIERIGSRGKILSWAPQQKVLSHPSVACFMSHCGWNSTLEGVTNGVPFLCWPYFADQFHNETYICDIWKNGLGLEKDEVGIITRGEIMSKAEKLLSDKTFKVKASYIKEKVTSKGGCSHKNLNNFIMDTKE
ncbi:putative 7-deoxyloganetin glucosyltransferase [Helianthus annuus]|nr:putative 7-deoxyloganetin glucosyltransferase [Helianthus annuus]